MKNDGCLPSSWQKARLTRFVATRLQHSQLAFASILHLLPLSIHHHSKSRSATRWLVAKSLPGLRPPSVTIDSPLFKFSHVSWAMKPQLFPLAFATPSTDRPCSFFLTPSQPLCSSTRRTAPGPAAETRIPPAAHRLWRARQCRQGRLQGRAQRPAA